MGVLLYLFGIAIAIYLLERTLVFFRRMLRSDDDEPTEGEILGFVPMPTPKPEPAVPDLATRSFDDNYDPSNDEVVFDELDEEDAS